MKQVTNTFKNKIKTLGRELDNIISYESNNETIELGNTILNSISLHYEGNILKSVMKQLDIDSNQDIPLNTIINYKFGIKVADNEVQDYKDNYEYIDYGNFIVYKSEKQEDKNSYRLTCYDKMLYSMVNYETPKVSGIAITYPITIRNYLSAICSHLGLTFANSSDSFVNYDKEIASELYLDSNGKSLSYTFRDVLDELAEVTGSSICINNNDELEIRYLIADNEETTSSLVQAKETSGNGITMTTYNNGDIKVNGTNTSTLLALRPIPLKGYTLLKGESYTLSCNEPTGTYTGSTTELFALSGDGTKELSPNSSITFTATKDFTPSLTIKTPRNQTFTNYTFRFTLTHYVDSVDSINEEFIKDVNVNFGKVFGPINTVILSRAQESDEISLSEPANLPDNEKFAIKIIDNQILSGNDRADYLPAILNELNGLTYTLNDYSSTGICYLELLDKYKVLIDNNIYKCIMLNDNIQIANGLKEDIYSEEPKNKTTREYITTSKDDREDTRANILVNKQLGSISLEVAQKLDSGDFTKAEIVAKINDNTSQVQIDADQIDINANDVLNILAGNTINLTSNTIAINSTNFSVDTSGNMTCNNATINGTISKTSYGQYENTTITLGDPNDTGNALEISGTGGFKSYMNPGNFITYYNNNITTMVGYGYTIQANNPYGETIFKADGYYDTTTIKKLVAGNIDCGNCTLNSSTLETVYFNKTFANVPRVVLTAHTSTAGAIVGKVRDVTETYFTAIIGGNVSGSVNFDWIAIG